MRALPLVPLALVVAFLVAPVASCPGRVLEACTVDADCAAGTCTDGVCGTAAEGEGGAAEGEGDAGEGEGEAGEGEGDAGEGEGEGGAGEGEGGAGEGEGGEGEGEGDCVDADGDGHGDGCALGPDCDDDNVAVFTLVTSAADVDGDGVTFGPSTVVCSDGTIPPGRAAPTAQTDCDDADPVVDSGCANGCFAGKLGARTLTICTAFFDHSPARARCAEQGLNLASIHSQSEEDFIVAVAHQVGVVTDRMWIGFNDTATPSWDDGSAVDYFDFPGGAHTGDQSAELCGVVTLADGLWTDDDCGGHSYAYACASAP